MCFIVELKRNADNDVGLFIARGIAGEAGEFGGVDTGGSKEVRAV